MKDTSLLMFDESIQTSENHNHRNPVDNTLVRKTMQLIFDLSGYEHATQILNSAFDKIPIFVEQEFKSNNNEEICCSIFYYWL
jgi:hypothetical protein